MQHACRELARSIVAPDRRPALVAVDGVDGSGKTAFAGGSLQPWRRRCDPRSRASMVIAP